MTKKTFFLFATLLITIGAWGQNQTETSIDSLYAQDIRATRLIYPDLYVKGMGQLSNILAANPGAKEKSFPIKYPQQAMEKNTQGIVYARFLIDTLGVVSGIKILKGPGDGCTDEVLSVLRQGAKEKWEPTILDGKKVTAYQKIYVKFVLD